jgi:hypothetical protein
MNFATLWFGGLFAAFAVIMLSGVQTDASAQSKQLLTVNTTAQEYGAQVRYAPEQTELWYAATRGAETSRSRRLMVAVWDNEKIESPQEAPIPLNTPLNEQDTISLDGSPTFGCDPNYMIFVSNRLANGESHGNDLYEARLEDHTWRVTKVNALNSEFWDDSPALSWDGSTIYFASDRRLPGRGVSDIYVSTRTASVWSVPQRLDGLTAYPDRFAVETPFFSRDGWLYFSSNESANGNFSIRRVRIDTTSKLPNGAPERLDWPSVNLPTCDVGHPWVSPGGHWLLFSSNRDTAGMKDLNIYSVACPPSQRSDSLHLNVLARTHRYDSVHEMWNDMMLAERSRISANPISGSILTDDRGTATIAIPQPESSGPNDDLPFLAIHLNAEPIRPQVNLISSSDVLLIDASAGETYEHTLYLWDTAVYYSHECKTDFKVRDIPFFIRGYWCPTTHRYDNCLSCASVFPDPMCTLLETPQPVLPCRPNDDLRVYKLDYTPPKISVREPEGLCVNHAEWRDSSLTYSKRVDSVLDLYVEEMKSVFSKEVWCVERAVERGDTIRIEVIGWTDPGSLFDDCLYTGEDIHFRDNPIQVTNPLRKKYIQSGIIRNGTNFLKTSKPSTKGNELLADLRAYYTAKLLDSLWRRSIPRYQELREKPGAIKLIAAGGGISTRSGIQYNEQRSVDVIVTAPLDQESASKKMLPPPGRTVNLSRSPCDEASIEKRIFNSRSK